ncbi:MAG: ATP-binding cassette domain-containing protein [Alphaproteobacteria bacterium]
MSSDKTLLTLRGVTVQFGREAILDDVSLSVEEGEIATVIGPNGAGKTTLLRVALGLQKPNAGTVLRRAGLRLGYMPQRLAIDDTLPLTVGRFLTLLGDSRDQDRGAIIEELGVGDLLRYPLQQISGGEMQRVLLTRALLRRPDLLILDEPAQGLDVGGQAEFYTLIGDIRDRLGCGVLIVSHDLHLVMAAADRVVCLNHHVCCRGKPQDVRRDPAYLALFPGQHPVPGLAVYEHAHDHSHTAAGEIIPAEEQTVA